MTDSFTCTIRVVNEGFDWTTTRSCDNVKDFPDEISSAINHSTSVLVGVGDGIMDLVQDLLCENKRYLINTDDSEELDLWEKMFDSTEALRLLVSENREKRRKRDRE